MAAAGEMLDESVDEHVAGAGVKGEDVGWLGVGGDYGDVGDAADIEADATEGFVAIESVIGEGNQWRALAAKGDIGWAEVRYGGDFCEGGDDRPVTDLQSGGGFYSEEMGGLALMEDGLAVVADEGDLFGRDAEFFAGG